MVIVSHLFLCKNLGWYDSF
jgi:hypothetical protein